MRNTGFGWLSGALIVFSLSPISEAARADAGPAAVVTSSTELAQSLREILLTLMPTPLYEDHKHWGGQKEVTRGLKWKGSGFDFHAEAQRKLKNDGLWWRVTVTVPDAANKLVLQVRDVQKPEPGKMNFTAFIGFDTDVLYERQRWDGGHRLISTSIRGRARVSLAVRCESGLRFEDKGNLIPDTIFRLRVTSSDFHFDRLVFEHVAGVGGDAAKAIGDIAMANVHLWRPSLESRFIEKANAAILKAGDTKDVRLGLGKLLDGSK
jgi:hypothetical protein